ncbi:MAG: AtzE family amidohydrolase [Minwuiales bacterium]|nr:AtzE family amidohydrolase [Minwuiales bacterium]
MTATATEIAAQVRGGELSATEVATAALGRIAADNERFNCLTEVTADRALAEAAAVDAARSRGDRLGPLAGVPYVAKNLFDVAGLTTLAGSRINAGNPPAVADATAVARLRDAGAVLLGAANMDEYAYGFTTENSHYGPTRNPHGPEHVAGGSSGGSAAAVAAGLTPVALGTDTNGSIRVPASFCGVFGLKPTYGRLSRAGVFLFAASLDHIGPFARSVGDLAALYDVLQGPDPGDPVCTTRPVEPAGASLAAGVGDLRLAVAGGYFAEGGEPEAAAAVGRGADALGATRRVELPESARARAGAFVMTTTESGNLHLANLRERPGDFDPLIRDRLLAGAMTPSNWYLQAQRFRRWYRDRVLALFRDVDIILAPATPCVAPKIGQETITLDGVELPTRPSMGLYTQPLSFIGLPIVVVPVATGGPLPIGVQVIAAPWREADALRVAAALEASGVAVASVPEVEESSNV